MWAASPAMNDSPASSASRSRLEQRQRSLGVAARSQQAAALERDPGGGPRRGHTRLGRGEPGFALLEAPAEPRDAGELRQHFGPPRVGRLPRELPWNTASDASRSSKCPERAKAIAHAATAA